MTFQREPSFAARVSIARRSIFQRSRASARGAGFTLIELILVLALLAIATSLVAPSLSRFFRERALGSEARQLLSLTHAGQSRAIAEGFPVLLWLDTAQGEYGIQMENTLQAAGSQDVDPKAESFTHDPGVKIEALDSDFVNVNGRSVHAIRFMPDGMADEKSPARLRLTSSLGDVLWLVQSTNRLSYEIRSTQF